MKLSDIMKRIGSLIMTSIQAGETYGWSEDFSHEKIKYDYRKIKDQLISIIGDITKLSPKELKDIGFDKWDNEGHADGDLYLVPLWAFDLIPDGTELESISGKKAIKGVDDIDLDMRYGSTAWGWRGKE